MDPDITEVIHGVACGLDVHSAVVVACLPRSGPNAGPRYEERSFATTLTGLGELREWLVSSDCRMAGIEATGVYWMPVFAALDNHLPLVVGNPSHMRNCANINRQDGKAGKT